MTKPTVTLIEFVLHHKIQFGKHKTTHDKQNDVCIHTRQITQVRLKAKNRC